MKKLPKLLCLAALVCLASCSGKRDIAMSPSHESIKAKTFPDPSEGKAALYIYRGDSVMGTAVKKNLWVDQQCVGESASSVFFIMEVEGNKEHTISTESAVADNDLTLYTEAGKRYFIHQYTTFGIFINGADLEVVPEERGMMVVNSLEMAELGNCTSTK